MTTTNENVESYDNLVLKYAGQWILINKNKVIFADKNFEIVMNKADKLKLNPNESEIEFIDSGDAVFYEIRIQNREN